MKDPFAVIIPDEASLTVPLAAATELTKIYIVAANKLSLLEAEIWTEDVLDTEGNVERTITHYPRDYKWFLDFCRKTAADIAKINVHAETKNIDQKLQLLDIFLNSDSVSAKMKEDFVENAIRSKEKPLKTIKNKGYEY